MKGKRVGVSVTAVTAVVGRGRSFALPNAFAPILQSRDGSAARRSILLSTPRLRPRMVHSSFVSRLPMVALRSQKDEAPEELKGQYGFVRSVLR